MSETGPNHVAIILDGNRRWAKKKKLPTIAGHRQSALNLRKLIKHLMAKGVHTVTIWIFSTENWSRDKKQVEGLMKLFQEFATMYFEDAMREETRVVHMGRKDRLSNSLRKKIEKYEESTKHFTSNVLNIALDYGGRDEVLRGIKRLSQADVSIDDLDIDGFNKYLDTAGQKHSDPDMIIRTGGDQRMSGFMIWQAAYAEYFFTKTLLPDLTDEDLDTFLLEYDERQRRYGK